MPSSPPPSIANPRHWPTYLAYLLMAGLARLPWAVQRVLGRCLGKIAYRLAKRRRQAAQINIALCFPHRDNAWRNHLVQANFAELGIGVFEFFRAWWGSIDAIRPVVHWQNRDQLAQLQKSGRGVLLVSGHFSTLEICGRLLCDHYQVAGMYRQHRDPVMEWAVRKGRMRYANAMFANEDVRSAVRHLKRGGILWYAPDQDMRGKQSVFVPFFGIPASTITATHQLARLTGCAVVPFFHERQGSNYRLRFGEPITDFPSDDVTADTARINHVIQTMVEQAPQQYLWIHRRFKRQPDGVGQYYQRSAPL